jgi:hypothetical protein
LRRRAQLQRASVSELRCRESPISDRLFSHRAAAFRRRAQRDAFAAVAAIAVSIVQSTGEYKPLFPVPQTPSTFHPHAQRNAFRRRDARQQYKIGVAFAIHG